MSILIMLYLASGCSSNDTSISRFPAPSDLDNLINQQACSPFATFELSELKVENNSWNAAQADSDRFGQCVFTLEDVSLGNFGWRWSYPGAAKTVMGYPEVIYGWKPWYPASTTEKLPIRLDKIDSIQVSYAVEYLDIKGTYNLAFDNWLSSSDLVNPGNAIFELMIWEDAGSLTPFGQYQGDVVTQSGTYAFYQGEPDWEPAGSNWTYLAFVRLEERQQGTVHLEDFIDYLIAQEIVSPEVYLASIEFGNEIGPGSGTTFVKAFEVTVNP